MKRAILLAALMLLLSGCSSVSPVIREAHEASGAAAERYAAGADMIAAAYLHDLEILLHKQADLIRFEVRRSGMSTADVDAQDSKARAAIRAKLAEVRDQIEANRVHVRQWRTLHQDLRGALLSLEGQQAAQKALADRAAKAAGLKGEAK